MQKKNTLSALRACCKLAAVPLLMAVVLPNWAQATQLTTLLDFDGNNGAYPDSTWVLDGAGSLYGTAKGLGYAGSVLKLSPPAPGYTAWTLTRLSKFNSPSDGYQPGPLLQGQDGNWYAVTVSGGTNGVGTIFRLAPPAVGQTKWTRTTLFNFDSTQAPLSSARLLRDVSGNLYGTTFDGGAGHGGSVFRLAPPAAGKKGWTLSTLVNFNGTNGALPFGGLIMDASGNLYGTTWWGGVDDDGTVFRLSPPAVGQSEWVLTTLVDFDGTHGNFPVAGLVADKVGHLYGTTTRGGANGLGTVFKLSPPLPGKTTWRLTTLADFTATSGHYPFAPLLRDASGNLYGTAFIGGADDDFGTVFKLSPPVTGQTAWTLATLVDFDGTNGKSPFAGLVRDALGNLYGATNSGGQYGFGTVFKVSP
ncbi:choice-of-anchor tandem repeat GloVer-containing protein [Methylovulum psychrotolerans]|uniref:Uncharacterized protein n=1 Tax=Methylovulum psychrotolerans TaxID=1704499 RepID=A0A1Z4BV13_9GAMM|nr:choice-of-anchor tandem repeat GloVer-containing protein [Methylovulum psychrotolerans]ASF45135.1 hypothetical protein CEK71_03120 [Methylovulum psychrotolerans]